MSAFKLIGLISMFEFNFTISHLFSMCATYNLVIFTFFSVFLGLM